MAKIEDRGSSYRITVQRTVNGKKERRSFTCKTKADVPKIKAAAAAWQAAACGYSSCELTLNEAAREYIELRRTVLSPGTIAGYEKIIRTSLGPLLGTKVCDITSKKSRSWLMSGSIKVCQQKPF